MGTVWRAPWREAEQGRHWWVRVDRWEQDIRSCLSGPPGGGREEGHSARAVDPESKQDRMGWGTGQGWGQGVLPGGLPCQAQGGAPLRGTACRPGDLLGVGDGGISGGGGIGGSSHTGPGGLEGRHRVGRWGDREKGAEDTPALHKGAGEEKRDWGSPRCPPGPWGPRRWAAGLGRQMEVGPGELRPAGGRPQLPVCRAGCGDWGARRGRAEGSTWRALDSIFGGLARAASRAVVVVPMLEPSKRG